MSTSLPGAVHEYRPDVVRKIKFRIIPFLVLLYIIAFIDRANIGYAALNMNEDLGISKTQFGLIAGLFSIGYFLFEVPSNMLMRKVGARRWIARILVSWGIVAVISGFVQSMTQLAIARTVLGIAEAGFFPAVILYLSFWFPERERARVVALFMVALPVATLIAGPLSGLILDHVHWFGIQSWRWIFILQGAPAVLLGIVALKLIVDLPAKAKWLKPDEAKWLADTLEYENAVKVKNHAQHGFLKSLAGARTLALALIYYSKSVAIYVLAFFTPSIVANLGDHMSNSLVGILSGAPYGLAAIAMVFWAKHSDRTQERRWHVAIPLFVAAGGLLLMVFAQDNLVVSLLLLTVITITVYCTYGPFWSLPSLFMTGTSAAVGIASINSIANLGGFVGPFGFGALEDATGSIYLGLSIVSGVLIISGLLVVRLKFVKTAEAAARRVVRTDGPGPETITRHATLAKTSKESR